MRNIYAIIILFSITSCSTEPDNAKHKAISTYITSRADDPDSYQSARWGNPVPYTQTDLNKVKSLALYDSATGMQAERQLLFEEAKSAAYAGDADVEQRKAKWSQAADAQIAVIRKADSLGIAKDSTRLGTVIKHAFRSKNKFGALVLDSANFLIWNDGKVQKL